jgi:hypothetical protein
MCEFRAFFYGSEKTALRNSRTISPEMPFHSSRDTLLLQLSIIGDSVSSLRAQLSEVGGALIETERRRLALKLRKIEREHQQLLESIGARRH